MTGGPQPLGDLSARSRRDVRVVERSGLGYADGVALQEHHVEALRDGRDGEVLLLVEHRPVVTLGRRAQPTDVLLGGEALAERGVELHEAARGGEVTYHGPGQRVGYPILDLRPDRMDVRRYLRDLETMLIAVAAEFGVEAAARPGLTGVWVGERKLASIGVRVADWITSHGFALNVGSDLGGFDLIVPCGISGCRMTSLSSELGREVGMEEPTGPLLRHFSQVFERRLDGGGAQEAHRGDL